MLSGCYVALVTPFRDGKVDVENLKDLVELHVEAGTHGLVPCGTTGESATLDHAEHELVIATVVETSAGRLPVLAGTGSNSTSEALRLTRFAKSCGADGALIITPYYNKPTQTGLHHHFASIAEAVDLPIVLYNVPGRTAVDLEAATVARLAENANIVGIKEATGSVDRAAEIFRACDIALLSGDDSLTLPLMAVGAQGVISVAANVAPRLMVELVDKIRGGDYNGARELHLRLFPLFKTLFVETNPIPVKTAMSMQGLCSDELRPPMSALEPSHGAQLESVLRELELLCV